jgi:hypothetical protein
MYAETDFLLALIKDEDWLGEAAEHVYDKHGDELWTSQYTLVELMLVGYREDRDVERTVANAADLIEIRGDVDTVVAAASYVEEYDLTPFDALHLVESNDETIVSSDSAYEEFDRRLDLREVDDR